jgi:hypothetical protein
MDCSICCESFTKLTRKQVICNHCSFSACTQCHQTYLLDAVNEPHCLNCRNAWSIEFMNQHFTKIFLTKEYREKREMVYFKEEETRFPALLPLAEQRKRLFQIDTLLVQKEHELHMNDRNEDQLVRDQRLNDKKIRWERDELRRRRNTISSRDPRREKREVVMKCKSAECKGFLDTKYHCGMCNITICKECHLTMTENHTCNPDDVATIVELKRSTKPCPQCHTPIYKTDGCDQMFCVQCHTPFSWRTGRVETGVIHNPHYFEALRAGNILHQRHQPHQGGCGPMRDSREIRRLLREFYNSQSMNEYDSSIMSQKIFYYYQQIVHHRAVTLPLFTRVNDREEERVRFLIGQLDEKKFKQRLYVYRVTSIRKIEEQQIVDLYVTSGEELFRSINPNNVLEIFQQLTSLQEITNGAIVEIDKKYTHKGFVKPMDFAL